MNIASAALTSGAALTPEITVLNNLYNHKIKEVIITTINNIRVVISRTGLFNKNILGF